MNLNARLSWSFALLLAGGASVAAAPALAADQIPWAADFQAACGMAAEQHRLVLLHFYNDNCGPCVRVEQNVFSKAEVAEAVSQNYVAVKVHAGKTPQLATRYRVHQWPTDVIVSPSGLEVFRTISPQRADDYIAMLNQVAQQTGVGLARQWKNQMRQTLAAAANTAQSAANATQGLASTPQAAANSVQAAVSSPQSAVSTAQSAANSAVDGAQQRAAQGFQQATNTAQQTAASAGRQWSQWSQQASDAVQQYEKQAGDAYKQFRQQTGEAAQQVQQQAGAVAQQVQTQAETTRSQWQATTEKATAEAGQAAQGLKDQMHQVTQTLLDRRSAFIPPDQSPATQQQAAQQPAAQQPAVAVASSTANPNTTSSAATASTAATAQALAPASSPPPTEKPAPALTTNPWVASNQPAASAHSHSGWSPPGGSTPPFIPAQPQPTASSPPAAAPSAELANRPMIPVSQAPPIALDGFCPVTLREVIEHNPVDRGAWKKGDRRFGAIHSGRTYLFASAEQQQKFLANPDAYAPVLAGCDPVLFAERGQMVDGKRAYGLITADHQVYLFADESSLNRFKQAPGNYAGAIQQAKIQAGAGNLYR